MRATPQNPALTSCKLPNQPANVPDSVLDLKSSRTRRRQANRGTQPLRQSRKRTLDADDIALVLRLGGGLHLLGQLVHVQLLVGALELPVPALAAQVALLLRLLRRRPGARMRNGAKPSGDKTGINAHPVDRQRRRASVRSCAAPALNIRCGQQ